MANRLSVLVGAALEQNVEKTLNAELKALEGKLNALSIKATFDGDFKQVIAGIQKAIDGIDFSKINATSADAAKNLSQVESTVNGISSAAKKTTKGIVDLNGEAKEFVETIKDADKDIVIKTKFDDSGQVSGGTVSYTDKSQVTLLNQRTAATKKLESAVKSLANASSKLKDVNERKAYDIDSIKKYGNEMVELKKIINSQTASLEDVRKAALRLNALQIEIDTKVDLEDKFNKQWQSIQSKLDLKSIKLNSQYGDLFNENELRSYYNILDDVNKELQQQQPNWSKIESLIAQANNKASKFEANLSATAKQVKEIERETQLLDSSLGRFVQFYWFGEIFRAEKTAVTEMVQAVSTLDSSMVELKKVSEETEDTYDRFLDKSADKAKELGITMSDYVDSVTNFARMGYDFEESQVVAEVANVMQMVSENMTADEASEYLISTMAGFGIEAQNALGIVDALNNVSNNLSITTDGLGESLKRSSAAMSAANNTLEETLALTAAANEVIQNPETVGNALKTISMNFVALRSNAYRKTYLKRGMLNAA